MDEAESCNATKSLSINVPAGCPIFLVDLPARAGPRPKTNPCLPHQQTSENPSKELWDKLVARVFSADLFPGSTGPHRSLVSLPDSLAMFLDGNPAIPCTHAVIGKEWAHVHGAKDGSLHVGLSEADAATVINANWGERHLLAGKNTGRMQVPEGLVMVYAPRDESDIEIIVRILKASYNYTRGDVEPLKRA